VLGFGCWFGSLDPPIYLSLTSVIVIRVNSSSHFIRHFWLAVVCRPTSRCHGARPNYFTWQRSQWIWA
jgi:hypothetical protein